MAFDNLKARWLAKTGEPMPPEILLLPLKKICKAVLLVEAGFTVAVPKGATRTEEVEESMMDWDRQDQKNGNAYRGS
jgi:hypothetical protein